MTARADAGTGNGDAGHNCGCIRRYQRGRRQRTSGRCSDWCHHHHMMNSGLQIANINSVWQLAVLGLILILAIILNHMMNKFVIRVRENRE